MLSEFYLVIFSHNIDILPHARARCHADDEKLKITKSHTYPWDAQFKGKNFFFFFRKSDCGAGGAPGDIVSYKDWN